MLGASKYGDFLNSPENITTNILASRLKRLEEEKIISKQAYQSNPVRYKYTLTEKGNGLSNVIKELTNWGLLFIEGTFIPENLIGLLKKGEEVQVEINAVPGKIYRGEIVEIGSSSIAYGNSFPVNIRIIEKDELLKPGMSAKVSFEFSHDENNKGETVLPLSALDQDSSDKMYVYTVTDIEDGVGIVKKSIVNIGKTYADGVEVLDGVNPGDYIVTSGVTQIVEGQEVSISSKEEN